MNSDELRSPERPMRSINQKTVYACFGIGIAAIGLIFFFLLSSPNSSNASAVETSVVVPAKVDLEVLERLPESYDEIDEKQAMATETKEPDDAPSRIERERFERQEYPPQPEYPDERVQRAESENESAARSSVVFASNGSEASVSMEREQAPSASQGMFFAQKSGLELSSKEKFLKGSGSSGPRSISSPLSKYAVMQGSIISAVLLTAINSDLPGPVLAQVTTNIFDTKSGKHLLIPQGTKIIGEYNSSVSYGQQRAQVAWTRMILPNTDSVDLGRMPGVDAAGASGAQGSVDRHYDQLAIGVLVTSLISGGVGLVQGPVNPTGATPQQIIGQSVGQEVARVGTKLADKALDVQPTLKVSIGTKINVFATEDLLLKPYAY